MHVIAAAQERPSRAADLMSGYQEPGVSEFILSDDPPVEEA
jgi:hypothetical protein